MKINCKITRHLCFYEATWQYDYSFHVYLKKYSKKSLVKNHTWNDEKNEKIKLSKSQKIQNFTDSIWYIFENMPKTTLIWKKNNFSMVEKKNKNNFPRWWIFWLLKLQVDKFSIPGIGQNLQTAIIMKFVIVVNKNMVN